MPLETEPINPMKHFEIHTICFFVAMAGFLAASPLRAAFTAPYALKPWTGPSFGAWTAYSTGAILWGGPVNISDAPDQLQLSVAPGFFDTPELDFTTVAAESGDVSLTSTSASVAGGGRIAWFCMRNGSTVAYQLLDQISGVPLACVFPVEAGDTFGFHLISAGDTGPIITLTVTNFTAPGMLPIIPPPIQLKNPVSMPGGIFQFTFTNSPSASMTVLASTNAMLPLTNWMELDGVIETSPGNYQFTDTDTTNFTRRFYLLRIP